MVKRMQEEKEGTAKAKSKNRPEQRVAQKTAGKRKKREKTGGTQEKRKRRSRGRGGDTSPKKGVIGSSQLIPRARYKPTGPATQVGASQATTGEECPSHRREEENLNTDARETSPTKNSREGTAAGKAHRKGPKSPSAGIRAERVPGRRERNLF